MNENWKKMMKMIKEVKGKNKEAEFKNDERARCQPWKDLFNKTISNGILISTIKKYGYIIF